MEHAHGRKAGTATVHMSQPHQHSSPRDEVVRADAVNGCHGGLGVQVAQSLENMGDAFTSRQGGQSALVK